MAKLLREIVAENIRKLRIEAGLTQVELAKRAKLTDVYISRVEQNSKNLTLDSIEQIASALGAPVGLLIAEGPTRVRKGNIKTVRALKHAVRVIEAYIEDIDAQDL